MAIRKSIRKTARKQQQSKRRGGKKTQKSWKKGKVGGLFGKSTPIRCGFSDKDSKIYEFVKHYQQGIENSWFDRQGKNLYVLKDFDCDKFAEFKTDVINSNKKEYSDEYILDMATKLLNFKNDSRNLKDINGQEFNINFNNIPNIRRKILNYVNN